MPEIAEIALTAEILEKNLKKKKLISFDFVSGRYTKRDPVGYSDFCESLPLTLNRVDSRGKFLWFEFSDSSNNVWYVWNTFGLTGMWSLANDDDTPNYLRAQLIFKGGINANFSDMRNFGTFKFSKNSNELNDKLDSLSPDFLKDDDFNLDNITKYKTPIVKILMDQKKVGSGLGNYLVAEILYRAGISPHRLGSTLTKADIKNLTYWIKYVVKLSYIDNHTGYMINLDKESSKIHRINYHPDIKLADKTFDFLVYRKKTDPDGNPVKAEKIVGTGDNKRTTYWVPKVQK